MQRAALVVGGAVSVEGQRAGVVSTQGFLYPIVSALS
jgi:hypothetical protein